MSESAEKLCIKPGFAALSGLFMFKKERERDGEGEGDREKQRIYYITAYYTTLLGKNEK